LDVLELNLHRLAGVDLKRDESFAGDLRIGLAIVDRDGAVEEDDDPIAEGAHHVMVPAVLVEPIHRPLGRLDERLIAARLVVETSPVALADVGLVARHLGSGDANASKLDAAIALAVDQSE